MKRASNYDPTLAWDRDHQPISYVYVLRDEHGRVSYVGMGRGTRFYESSLSTYACAGEIIAAGLTRQQALEIEARLIRIMGRAGVDPFGILRNRQLRA
jgi:hypothetical protein